MDNSEYIQLGMVEAEQKAKGSGSMSESELIALRDRINQAEAAYVAPYKPAINYLEQEEPDDGSLRPAQIRAFKAMAIFSGLIVSTVALSQAAAAGAFISVAKWAGIAFIIVFLVSGMLSGNTTKAVNHASSGNTGGSSSSAGGGNCCCGGTTINNNINVNQSQSNK